MHCMPTTFLVDEEDANGTSDDAEFRSALAVLSPLVARMGRPKVVRVVVYKNQSHEFHMYDALTGKTIHIKGC